MVRIKPDKPYTEDLPLTHTALFKQVPLDQARELLEHLHESVFSKGQAIFNECGLLSEMESAYPYP